MGQSQTNVLKCSKLSSMLPSFNCSSWRKKLCHDISKGSNQCKRYKYENMCLKIKLKIWSCFSIVTGFPDFCYLALSTKIHPAHEFWFLLFCHADSWLGVLLNRPGKICPFTRLRPDARVIGNLFAHYPARRGHLLKVLKSIQFSFRPLILFPTMVRTLSFLFCSSYRHHTASLSNHLPSLCLWIKLLIPTYSLPAHTIIATPPHCHPLYPHQPMTMASFHTFIVFSVFYSTRSWSRCSTALGLITWPGAQVIPILWARIWPVSIPLRWVGSKGDMGLKKGWDLQ